MLNYFRGGLFVVVWRWFGVFWGGLGCFGWFGVFQWAAF